MGFCVGTTLTKPCKTTENQNKNIHSQSKNNIFFVGALGPNHFALVHRDDHEAPCQEVLWTWGLLKYNTSAVQYLLQKEIKGRFRSEWTMFFSLNGIPKFLESNRDYGRCSKSTAVSNFSCNYIGTVPIYLKWPLLVPISLSYRLLSFKADVGENFGNFCQHPFARLAICRLGWMRLQRPAWQWKTQWPCQAAVQTRSIWASPGWKKVELANRTSCFGDIWTTSYDAIFWWIYDIQFGYVWLCFIL